MITERTLEIARATAADLRRQGESERARAIDALVEAVADETVPALDLLTSTQAGELLGVTGQTTKNWVRGGQLAGFRVGGRIMVPRDAVAEYLQRACRSLELDVLSDDEAARLVAEGRSHS
jgi:excisionase family DNA binding protein